MDKGNNQDKQITEKLIQVGRAFRINKPLFSYEELKNGNVNHTYKVNYIDDDGNGLAVIKSYLVQRINTVAFEKPIELMQNIDKVTTYIRNNYPGRISLHFHHTASGENYLIDDNGFWRMSNYIPSVTYNTGDNPVIAKNSGKAFGEFQTMLEKFDASSLYYTIPDFHDTRKRYENFKKAISENKADRKDECKEEIEWLLSVENEACKLTDLYNEGKLPLRVTHNDTKINNILFDEETLEPLVVIDLDTVMPGLVGHDFGDAIRFAANFTEEDAEDISKIGLDLNIFYAFAEGFLSQTAKSLTEDEIETLSVSCFALACELSTRFLADYLNGDLYFKTKKPMHNLIRARAQIALAKDIYEKLDAMTAICEVCYKKFK